MITLRPSLERGHAINSWLDSYHTFSFASYYDPAHMGFRSLRVINEDRVAGGGGFPEHPHSDMEILTWVVEGALEHRDSMGSGSVIRPRQIQHMSAASGVTHSEFNHSQKDPVHLLQIWIKPDRKGGEPAYGERDFRGDAIVGRLRLLASPDGADDSIAIRQDASLHAAELAPGQKISHHLGRERHGWLQVVRGKLTLNATALSAGDGAAISSEDDLEISAVDQCEFLLFDLA